MAEELKSRLLFKNPASQRQTLWKLLNEVLEKGKILKGQPYTGFGNEPPELGIFWDCCASDSLVVSTASAECLVTLVFHKQVGFSYAMKKMINIVPVAKNSCAVIQAITDLLLLEICWSEESNEEYCCPYNLRSPPHPYISVLTSSPYASWLLMEQVRQLLDNEIKRVSEPCAVLRMLEPFFKFILLVPSGGMDTHLPLALHSDLLIAAGGQVIGDQEKLKTFRNYLTSFLVSVVPYYQVDKQSIGKTVFLVKQLTHWLLEQHQQIICCDRWRSEANTSEISGTWKFVGLYTCMSKLLYHSVSLCWHQLHCGYDMASTLALLNKVHRTTPEIFLDSTVIAAISFLLLESPSRYHGLILELCLHILQSAEQGDGVTSTVMVKTGGCFLLFPILQILSTSINKTWTVTNNGPSSQDLAKQLLTALESISFQENNQDIEKETQSCTLPNIPMSSWMRVNWNMVVMLQTLLRNERVLISWLKTQQSSLPMQTKVPHHVTMLLSVLFVKSSDSAAEEVLKVLQLVPKVDPCQGPTLIPLLLYKLGREITSTLRLQILYNLPRLATHRITVGPILRIIQTIGISPNLRPLAIRLLCKLWCEQSRVFPYLQKLLVAADEDVMGREIVEELHIAKAATIKDICVTRPAQHGTDLVAHLSKLLTENTGPEAVENDASSIIVKYSLDGLQSLCQSQVVDLRTAWKVLSTRLLADERPQVLASACCLLSLVPQFTAVSEEYENPRVAGAAYSALSHFPVEDLKMKYLPPEIQDPIKQKLFSKYKLAKSETENEGEEEKEKVLDDLVCPGSALVQLLERSGEEVLPDFQRLLTSVVQHEVASLPRGLAYSVTRSSTQGSRSLDGIPITLLSQYEKSKTPGMSQGLAAGLLFSYEPVAEHRHDKRKRTQLLQNGRSYRSMLDSLLHEVPVQPSEWHRNMLVSQAWASFMNRAYNTCLEGRIAELEMQHNRGHIKEAEELENKKKCAWLWLRDELTNQLRSASKGNPSVQANSVLGLAGLASTVASYMARQPDSDETSGTVSSSQGQRYQSTREWLAVVTDTLMAILDGNYKVKGPTLQWCQQVSSSKSTASSLLARANAALSLSQLVPVLVTLDVGRITEIICLLREKLPGQPKCGSSAVVQFHCSLGLGLVLSKLYEERFSDLSGKEGYLLISTALDLLEGVALSSDAENTEGAILGAGVALVSLCKEGLVDSRVHATTMHQKLKALLVEHENDPGLKLQFLCMGVSCLTVSAFHAGLISVSVASECVVHLHQLLQRHPQTSAVSLSFGLLLHGLARSGHPEVPELAAHQTNVWKTRLTDQDAPMLQRLSAVNGLLALFGSEQRFFQVESDADIDVVKGNLAEVVKVLLKIISGAGQDVGLATNVAWLLGHLYDALTSSPVSRTSVPPSYSYLPESSHLRALFDFLVSSGKAVSYSGNSCATVNVALESLISGPKTVLPPVNWASVLAPLMRSTLGDETRQLCLRFAVLQARSSASLASFLSAWLKPGPFSELQVLCKREVLRSLGSIVTSIPLAQTQEFLEGMLVGLFTSDEEGSLHGDVLGGLKSVLELNDPPPSIFPSACATVEALYKISCDKLEKSNSQLCSLAKCLVHLPGDRLETLLENTQIVPSVRTKVISELVRQGGLSLKWLRMTIDFIIKAKSSQELQTARSFPDLKATCCFYLELNGDIVLSGDRVCPQEVALQVVSAVRGSCDHSQRVDERIQWILEVTGQLTDVVSSPPCNQMVVFSLLAIVSGAALWWADDSLAASVEFSPDGVLNQSESSDNLVYNERLFDYLLQLLPHSLSSLLRKETWTSLANKILQWLLTLRKSPICHANEQLYCLIQDTLLALKDLSSYKDVAVWAEAVADIKCVLDTS